MAQQPFGIRFGRPDTTSLNVVCCSLVEGDVTVTLASGHSVTVTLTALGTDNTPTQDQAGFVGNGTITGLSPFTRYTYTAEQAGEVLDFDENGDPWYTWTAPEENDDFIIFPVTCDNSGSIGGAQPGGYATIRSICAGNPGKGAYIVHIDDHLGYVDFNTVNEGAFGQGHVVSGYPSSAATTAKVYDYALGAFAAFGLFHPSGVSECTWGQNADRIWCMRNIPVLPQWGDHDAGLNEMGWDYDPTDTTTTGNGGATGAHNPPPKTCYDNARAVYDAFLEPLQGDYLSVLTSYAWTHKLGCIKFLAPDGISNGTGDATVNTGNLATEFAPPATIYGADQINRLIAAADDSSVPFKIMLMNYGIRWTVADPGTPAPDQGTGRNGRGCQNPIAGNESYATPRTAHSEYAALMTDAGSIMSKVTCNGQGGVFMLIHGDYHCGGVQVHKNAVGTNPEWFYDINVGTINGSANFPSPGETGNTYDGTTVEMESGAIRNGTEWWAVTMYVYGSRVVKEIEIDFTDDSRVSLWNKKITSRSMNDAISLTTNTDITGSGSGEGGLSL